MSELVANSVRRAGQWSGEVRARIALDYEGRFLRRKRIDLAYGSHTEDQSVLVDLPETISLEEGDALDCGAAGLIEVVAAPEELLRIRGDLVRLAWHIGNRHTPCQVEADSLLIKNDHVLERMLVQLGASIEHVTEPFRPEGGAYGHGRTHGHSH